MVRDDGESVNRSEEKVMSDREITSPDLSSMIPQKRRPTLAARGPMGLFHIFLDREFTHRDAQFEELTHYFFGAPEMILASHLLDEGNGLSRSEWFTALSFGVVFPVTLKHISMPTQDGVGLDDMQSRLPEVGEASQKGQTSPVTRCEIRPFNRAFEDDELLAEDGVLDEEVSLGSRQIGDDANREGDIGRFGPGFDSFFDAIVQTFASIPDRRKHDELNSIWGRFKMEANGS
jgi:hypothetical protein